MKTVKFSYLLTALLMLVPAMLFFPSGETEQPVRSRGTIGNPASLHVAYKNWQNQKSLGGQKDVLTLRLGSSKGFSRNPASGQGTVKINLASGTVGLDVTDLPAGAAFDAWIVDNRDLPGLSVRPEPADDFLYLGQLQTTADGRAELHTALAAETFQTVEIDLVAITTQGVRPDVEVLLVGVPVLFQRMYSATYRRFAQGDADAAILNFGPADATAAAPQSSAAMLATLVEEGEDLFFNETFDGNGRTCGTCHPAENNFTIDPAFIATLPDDDPLFVAEFNPALNKDTNGGLQFENPTLMRDFGLITVNIDGFDDPANKFTMRSVSHLFAQALSLTPSTRDGTDLSIVHRTGWSGDGSHGTGSFREFPIGAVIQHNPKTMGRVEGVDFRLPTDAELDALEAFQLSLGRQEEYDLDAITFLDPEIAAGKELFLRSGKCNRCHGNGGAIVTLGPSKETNGNFDTGVEDFRHPADDVDELRPRDGGFGTEGTLEDGFGDGSFNVPSVIESADTAPFFHNNAALTLEDAVSFYGSDEFAASPGSAEVNGISLNNNFVKQIADFLRALNTLENIRAGVAFIETASPLGLEEAQKPLQQAWEDVDDAVRVLEDASLLGQTRGQVRRARDFIEMAQDATDIETRDFYILKALIRLNAGRDAMATFETVASTEEHRREDQFVIPEDEMQPAETAPATDEWATETPTAFTLAQNFPNPFNPSTEIGFTLPEASNVKISVFDSIGREIRVLTEGAYDAGEHRVTWDGRDQQGQPVATGTYLYQLRAGNQAFTRTMVMVK